MDATGMLERKCHETEDGSVNILSGECQANNVRQMIQKMTGMIPCWNCSIWKKSLIQIQTSRELKGTQPGDSTNNSADQRGSNMIQIVLKLGQARNLLLISTLAEWETDWHYVLTVFKKYLKYKNISLCSFNSEAVLQLSKTLDQHIFTRKISKRHKSFGLFILHKHYFWDSVSWHWLEQLRRGFCSSLIYGQRLHHCCLKSTRIPIFFSAKTPDYMLFAEVSLGWVFAREKTLNGGNSKWDYGDKKNQYSLLHTFIQKPGHARK